MTEQISSRMHLLDSAYVGYRISFSDGTYYIGITSNLKTRISAHRGKRGCIDAWWRENEQVEWYDIADHYTVEILAELKGREDALLWENIVHNSLLEPEKCRSQASHDYAIPRFDHDIRQMVAA